MLPEVPFFTGWFLCHWSWGSPDTAEVTSHGHVGVGCGGHPGPSEECEHRVDTRCSWLSAPHRTVPTQQAASRVWASPPSLWVSPVGVGTFSALVPVQCGHRPPACSLVPAWPLLDHPAGQILRHLLSPPGPQLCLPGSVRGLTSDQRCNAHSPRKVVL